MIRKQMEHDLWSFETSHKIAETRDRMIKKEMCERAAAQGETSGNANCWNNSLKKNTLSKQIIGYIP